MPHRYSSSIRRQIVARPRSSESVAVLAAETDICQATLFRRKRRALIDAGVIEGIPRAPSEGVNEPSATSWSAGTLAYSA